MEWRAGQECSQSCGSHGDWPSALSDAWTARAPDRQPIMPTIHARPWIDTAALPGQCPDVNGT